MKKYNIATLVCFGLPLNLLFEYFAIHQNPPKDFSADYLGDK